MKTICTIFLMIVVSMSLPIGVHAQDTGIRVETVSMIEDDYQVNDFLVYEQDSISVTREIIYNGKVTPAKTISMTEEHNGIMYSGTLTLRSCMYVNNQTVATYSGTLSPQNLVM